MHVRNLLSVLLGSVLPDGAFGQGVAASQTVNPDAPPEPHSMPPGTLSCQGTSVSEHKPQNPGLLSWQVDGMPVALYTSEPTGVWEFRARLKARVRTGKMAWEALAPFIKQTGAGNLCVPKILGIPELEGLDVFLQVRLHLNQTHSYHQCATIHFTGGNSVHDLTHCKTDPTVNAAWTKGIRMDGDETYDGQPAIPADVDDAVCPDVGAPVAPASTVVLGSMDGGSCVMYLQRMSDDDFRHEINGTYEGNGGLRRKGSAAAPRAQLMASTVLVVAVAAGLSAWLGW